MNLLRTPLDRLRVIGWIEGTSFLVLLLIAMPLKYAANMPSAVKVVGTAHGFLWVLYLLLLALAWQAERWPIKVPILGFIASVIPMGPVFFDRWLSRETAPA